MKYLILLFLISFNLHASNWLNHSKIKSGSVEAYSLKSDCERISQEKCYDLESYPSSVFSEATILVDDYSKPIYDQKDTQSCSNETECTAKFVALVCSENLYQKIKNIDLLQVYCVKLAGYEKKEEKIISLDPNKVSAWESQKAIEAQKATKEAQINSAEKRMASGRRVIALMLVRNSAKGLTKPQVAQMNSLYSSIKNLLETGSLETAKEAIQAITPDGTIVTNADKEDLVNEIDKEIVKLAN